MQTTNKCKRHNTTSIAIWKLPFFIGQGKILLHVYWIHEKSSVRFLQSALPEQVDPLIKCCGTSHGLCTHAMAYCMIASDQPWPFVSSQRSEKMSQINFQVAFQVTIGHLQSSGVPCPQCTPHKHMWCAGLQHFIEDGCVHIKVCSVRWLLTITLTE